VGACIFAAGVFTLANPTLGRSQARFDSEVAKPWLAQKQAEVTAERHSIAKAAEAVSNHTRAHPALAGKTAQSFRTELERK
jgi:hypothetical protein